MKKGKDLQAIRALHFLSAQFKLVGARSPSCECRGQARKRSSILPVPGKALPRGRGLSRSFMPRAPRARARRQAGANGRARGECAAGWLGKGATPRVAASMAHRGSDRGQECRHSGPGLRPAARPAAESEGCGRSGRRGLQGPRAPRPRASLSRSAADGSQAWAGRP